MSSKLRPSWCWVSMILLAAVSLAAASSLNWQNHTGYRCAVLPTPGQSDAGFFLAGPQDTGITFSNRLSSASIANNRLLEIGSGVALGDIDGDGWVDIYFCGLENQNALYRNLGNWKFEEITAQAGVACPNQYSTGCILVDLDGDGDLDLLVNSLGGGTRVFLNDSRGRFTELIDSGLFRQLGATSMALGDVDGDGDLDLYITNYRTDSFVDNPPGLKIEMRRQTNGVIMAEPLDRFVTITQRSGAPTVVERGEPDFLYLNRNGRTFVPVRWNIGVFVDADGQALSGAPTDWGLSVMFRDLNGDRLPDLYICNDFVSWPDRVWINQNGKRFRAISRTALRSTSLSSMTVDVSDINRDGFDDIFVADMLNPQRAVRAWQRPDTLQDSVSWPVEDPEFRPELPRNTLQLARGDGSFSEIAQLSGLTATDWTTSAVFLDVDLDGWEDLLLSTGNYHDVQDMDAQAEVRAKATGSWKTAEMRLKDWAKLPQRATPCMAFRNRHNLTFEDTSSKWGFNAVGIAHGMALADLDNDGDLDVVINAMNEPARVYRNNAPAPRIAVRLKGARANTRGIGARIKVAGGPVSQSQEMIAGGRFCSSDDPMRVFAAGNSSRLKIEVHWRSGKCSIVEDAQPNYVYEIEEVGATNAPPILPQSPPLFIDVSSQLNHVHKNTAFNDFERQPLLPHKLSTLGPGITWADLNGAGQDDLIIPGGKESRTAIYHYDNRMGWTERTNALGTAINLRPQTTALISRSSNGAPCLVIGESNWEDADSHAPPFRQYNLKSDARIELPKVMESGVSSSGPLAMADVDADGDLDLFIGGRAVAGRYPEPATSYLLRNNGGAFSVAHTFTNLGLVSGAVFFDYDSDGYPDLALACQWDSIRIFRNQKGRFTESTVALGFNSYKGWWNGVAAADFDGDGRLDLAASNWGRNWRTDQTPDMDPTVRLYYGEFADNGVVQTFLASADPNLGKITPWRERKAVLAAIPSLVERAPNYHAYGRASIQELLGDQFQKARELQANATESMIFLNRGDHFEPRRLPIEAQFAPAFGISIADFDGDGSEDLFLAQNFFGVDAETSRQDAGIGLVLLGDGQGGFRALGPLESGIAIYGEQRGSAVADFDCDGQVDLAVAQHSGQTKLFRNARGAPGVRITLQGSKENPTAVGAIVRLQFSNRIGPARLISSGSGYWSQDSANLVLATPQLPTQLKIRWPDGLEQVWPWPTGARSVEVSKVGIQTGQRTVNAR